MSIEQCVLARPYAKALMSIGAQDLETEQHWSSVLEVCTQVFQKPVFMAWASCASPERMMQLCAECVDQVAPESRTHLGALWTNFLSVLVENRRITILPKIAELYEELRDRHHHRVRVWIESPAAIKKCMRESIEQKISQLLGSCIVPKYVLNSFLIGGITIRTRQGVWDGSIRGRLTRFVNFLNKR